MKTSPCKFQAITTIHPSSISLAAGYLRKAAASVKRIAIALREMLPESYPWMPEEEAQKLIPDLENFAVFNGRWVRVRRRHPSTDR